MITARKSKSKSEITLADCHCPLGKYVNQRGQNVCVFVAMYHELDCPIRKRIVSSEYGYNTYPFGGGT